MKTIKEYAEEMRTMAEMLNEAADALEDYQDAQLQRRVPRKPPSRRSLESQRYLARKNPEKV